MLQPVGRQYSSGPATFGLAVSANGEYAVTANSGPDEFSISIMRRDQDGRYVLRDLAAPAEASQEAKQDTWRTVSTGVAFAGENDVFVSEGNSGRVRRINPGSPKKAQLYELNREGFAQSFTGDLAYDARRQLLYVVDQANFRIAVVDARSRRVTGSATVGRLRWRSPCPPTVSEST
jgi:DNA-binding beta-propeller fold protein YncE